MSRPVVFATYSNSTTDPLAALNVERENIYTCFLRSMIHQQVVYVAPPFDVKSKDFDGLVEQFTHLTIFHYSGHASSNSLLIEEKRFLSSQLNNLLKGITVEIVILNGCSTKGFVKELLKKKGVKAVIATERKVNDTFATAFATRFYKALLSGKLLLDAFANGKSVSEDNEDCGDYRSLDTGGEEDDQCPFGIYYNESDPVKVSQVEQFRLIDPAAEAVETLIDAGIKSKIEGLEAKGLKLQQAIDGYSQGSPFALDLIQSLLDNLNQLEKLNLPEFDPANPANTMLALYDRMANLVMKQYEPIEEVRLLTKFQLFDYELQRDHHTSLIKKGYDIRAFLLQGSPQSGLGLLQQIIQDLIDLPVGNDRLEMLYMVLNPISGPSTPHSTAAIWQAVGKKVGRQQVDEIVREIHRRSSFKPVIMVFLGGETEEMIRLILSEFWSEFKSRFQTLLPKMNSSNQILLFVQAIFGEGRLPSYDQHSMDKDVCILPVVKRIDQEVINRWGNVIPYPYDMSFLNKASLPPHVAVALKEICSQLKGRDPKYWNFYTNRLERYLRPNPFSL